MTLEGCSHKPRCPATVSRWDCARRSEIEHAVLEDVFTREAGARLLQHYGQPMTPASRVYKGEKPKQQPFLV